MSTVTATVATPQRPPTSGVIPADPVVRRLAVLTLVNTFGNGLFYTVSALFFTRVVGLSVTQVGAGLTIAGGLGVAAGVPLGHLADRIGVRPLLVALLLAEAAGMVGYTLVHSFSAFLPIVCLTTIVDRGGAAVRNAMFAVVLPAETRTRVRAYLRAVTNVGIGAGSALAAVALHADTRAAYVALILVNGATFVVAALIMLRIPVPRATRPQHRVRQRNRALSDLPFLVVTALSAILAMQFGLLEIGVPLWIVGHTDAPRVVVAVTLVVNTALVVVLQVRASRYVDTVRRAARGCRWAGLLLAASCVIYAFAAGLPAWVATTILVVAVVVQTMGEVVSSAAGWQLSYDLAAQDAPGAYQGVFSSGFALGSMLAPLVVTATALHLELAGWAILGGIFAVAGAAVVPAAAWAARSRDERVLIAVP